jgi:hypothetical protein
MFCPQCGSTQADDLRFCKACGANLEAVRMAVANPERPGQFDWNKTWVAEMLQGSEAAVRRAAELERLQGITPETKRRNEIKQGIVTASVGLSAMIVIYVIMQGIILGGRVPEEAVQILSRVWIAGLIPTFVGFAMVFNGLFVSKRGELPAAPHANPDTSQPRDLKMPEATQIGPGAPFSVTDQTTRHLEEVPRRRTTTEFPEIR